MLAQAVHVFFTALVPTNGVGGLIQFALLAFPRAQGAAIELRDYPLGALAEVPAEQAGTLPRCLLAQFALLPVAGVGAIEIPQLLVHARLERRTGLIRTERPGEFTILGGLRRGRQAENGRHQSAGDNHQGGF
ncbi:MAG: hypothetical protein WCF11_12845, partial [Azonexus sp.]